jgi:hypothetical protein
LWRPAERRDTLDDETGNRRLASLRAGGPWSSAPGGGKPFGPAKEGEPMNFVMDNVTVTNWSKEPLLTMSDIEKAKLKTAINYARQIVSDALTLLRDYSRMLITKSVDAQMAADYFSATNNQTVEEALPKYMGMDPTDATFEADLNTVIAKYQQIKTGLDGAFTLVVGHVHDGDDISEGLQDAWQSLKQGNFRDAINDIKDIRTSTRGWVGPPSHAQRRIHLNISVIQNDTEGYIARTIVHEASHKFAGTADVAYKFHGLKNNTGNHAGLTNNADSYAWAGRLMWKRKRNLAGGT